MSIRTPACVCPLALVAVTVWLMGPLFVEVAVPLITPVVVLKLSPLPMAGATA